MKKVIAALCLLVVAVSAHAWEIESFPAFISLKDAPRKYGYSNEPGIDSALIRKDAIAMVSVGKSRASHVVSLRFERVSKVEPAGQGAGSRSDALSFSFDSRKDAEEFYTTLTEALTSANHTRKKSKATTIKPPARSN